MNTQNLYSTKDTATMIYHKYIQNENDIKEHKTAVHISKAAIKNEEIRHKKGIKKEISAKCWYFVHMMECYKTTSNILHPSSKMF